MRHKNGSLPAESAAAMAGEQSLVDAPDEELHPLYPNSNLFYGVFSIIFLTEDNTLYFNNDMCNDVRKLTKIYLEWKTLD